MFEVDPEKIRGSLKSKVFGRRIYFFDKIDSTNNYAWSMAEKGEEEGAVVLARVQELGRGRMNREWFSPAGGLWFSIILRPKLSALEAEKITLMAGVSVAESIKELYGLDVKLKWVNDVLIKDKKICGILTESSIVGERLEFVILGVGLNANVYFFPNNLINAATSLAIELRRPVDLNELMINLLKHLEENYELLERDKGLGVIRKWKIFSNSLGRMVKVYVDGEAYTGLALDLDDNGFLILELMSGHRIKIKTGTCRYLE